MLDRACPALAGGDGAAIWTVSALLWMEDCMFKGLTRSLLIVFGMITAVPYVMIAIVE